VHIASVYIAGVHIASDGPHAFAARLAPGRASGVALGRGLGSWPWIVALGRDPGSWPWIVALDRGPGSWPWIVALDRRPGSSPWIVALGARMS
jgi:hypothetical protein